MTRILFRRARSGFRTVRGDLVRSLQSALTGAGCEPGPVDEVFGNYTEAALRRWQERRGEEPTGLVDFDTWTRLTSRPAPSLFERCLQLTAAFEGHGFGRVAGNFDGAGLTWGVIGFTLAHGEIGRIVTTVHQHHPEILQRAFGELEDELRQVLERPLESQLAWATSISVGARRDHVEPSWRDAFERFGAEPEVRRLQLSRAQDIYWRRAEEDAADLGLETELGYALCFDVAVQNGGVERDERERLRFLWEQQPPATERDRRTLVATVVAEGSRPRWVEDVRKRKLTIALGQGTVHEGMYEVSTWGLDDVPGRQDEEAPPPEGAED